jgi:hypothetical protein
MMIEPRSELVKNVFALDGEAKKNQNCTELKSVVMGDMGEREDIKEEWDGKAL